MQRYSVACVYLLAAVGIASSLFAQEELNLTVTPAPSPILAASPRIPEPTPTVPAPTPIVPLPSPSVPQPSVTPEPLAAVTGPSAVQTSSSFRWSEKGAPVSTL